MSVAVVRDGPITVLQMINSTFLVHNVTITDAEGVEHPGVVARFTNEDTGLAFELVFDDDGWKRLCAARAGIVLATQLPQNGPQG